MYCFCFLITKVYFLSFFSSVLRSGDVIPYLPSPSPLRLSLSLPSPPLTTTTARGKQPQNTAPQTRSSPPACSSAPGSFSGPRSFRQQLQAQLRVWSRKLLSWRRRGGGRRSMNNKNKIVFIFGLKSQTSQKPITSFFFLYKKVKKKVTYTCGLVVLIDLTIVLYIYKNWEKVERD